MQIVRRSLETPGQDQPKQELIVCRTPQPERIKQSLKALGDLALARRTELSQPEFTLFSGALQEFEPDDVTMALRKIGQRPRQQYEPAVPDLGTLIQACTDERNARVEALFPPKPGLLVQRPRFIADCTGPHVTNLGLPLKAYLDHDGNPVPHDQSPDRILGECKCVREARDAEKTWEQEHWWPYMRELREWESECAAIRRAHHALMEAA